MRTYFNIVAIIAAIALLTSCNRGYDQKVVDGFDKENLSESDYREMVKQVRYAFEDARKASDFSKWENENIEEAEAMVGMLFALKVGLEEDTEFPDALKPDVEELSKELGRLLMQSEENSSVGENAEAIFMELAGEGEVYECHFMPGTTNFYISIVPETGSGVYLSPSGNVYVLTIEEESPNRTQFVCSATTTDGEATNLKFDFMISGYKINGHMIGTDGKTLFLFTGTEQ